MLADYPVLGIADLAAKFAFSLADSADRIKEFQRLGNFPDDVCVHDDGNSAFCCCLADLSFEDPHPRIEFVDPLDRGRPLEIPAWTGDFVCWLAEGCNQRRFSLSYLERDKLQCQNGYYKHDKYCDSYIFHFVPVSSKPPSSYKLGVGFP